MHVPVPDILRLNARTPTSPLAYAIALAASHKLNGTSAAHLLQTLETEMPKEVDPYLQAAYAALKGDHDQAIDQLGKAIETTPSRQIEACLNPAFHHLRQDPRFRQITQDPPNYPNIDHL